MDIFFVGINPVTPIFPKYMEIDKYVELLLNYDEFIDYYKASRISQDKDEISRTRIGMNSFFSWLSKHTDSSILETDVIPYPTAKLKELKKEPQFVKEKGKEIFYSLVAEFKPSLIILHGKKTVEHVREIFIERGLISPNDIDVEQLIEEMEKRAPLVQFKYSNGKTGVIMSCRHFMYYGSKGESFEPFRDKVLDILKNGPSTITEGLRHQEQYECNNPTSQTLRTQGSKSSQEYPLLREALGQLITINECDENDRLAVAVPN